MIQYHEMQEDGVYHVDLDISKERWISILADPKILGNAMDTLLKFYRSAEHKSTCIGLAGENSPQSHNAILMNFGKRVANMLQIEVINISGKPSYWSIPMKEGRTLPDGHFEWTLRDELVEAIKEYLIAELIKRYKIEFLEVPLDGDNADELYKWELITLCANQSTIDIIENFKKKNIVDIQRVNPVLTNLLKTNKEGLQSAFALLSDESMDLKYRLAQFKTRMASLCGDKYNIKANDERTAAAFLACFNPQKYTFYKDEIYQKYCKYIGVPTLQAGEKYPHFLELMTELAKAIKQETDLVNKYQSETNGLIQSDLLIAQNILWQMKEIMNNKDDNYLRFKHLLEYFVSHLEWCVNKDENFIGYHKYIQTLIDNNNFKLSGQGWNGGNIQKQIEQWAQYDSYFIYINVYGGNYQSNACYLQWNDTWLNVRPLWEDGHIKKLYLTKEEKSSAKEELTKTVQELGLFDNKEPNPTLKAFFDEYEMMIFEYSGVLHNKLYMKQLEQYTEILSRKKNIILQGAPGTGKTYNTAALALATLGITDVDLSDHRAVMERYEQQRFDKEKNPNGQIGFCTFHQSLDYEDFVEGIKIQKSENGNVAYNVEDGIFKCISDKAKENFELSKKNSDEIKTEIRTREVFNSFCEDLQTKLIEADFVELYPKSKMKIRKVIFKNDGTALSIGLAKDENSDFQSLTWEIISRDYNDFKSQKIKSYLDIKPRYESKSSFHGNAIYYFELYKKMYEFEKSSLPKDETQPTPVSMKNYVLIIDEINRGNVSKIFGELITLLEADKRIGSDHPIIVTLPYSKDSFGIPSNLYIIGTMNTTDRSTGTLDYALRRRFAFVTLQSKEEVVANHYKEIGNPDLEAKAVNLFKNIKEFLGDSKHLCGDFDIDDLMVGHSYFMAKDEEGLKLKMEYEVVPLINEYINDGILRVDAKEREKAFNAWRNLDTITVHNEEESTEKVQENGNAE